MKPTYKKLEKKPEGWTEENWKVYNQLWEENKDDLLTLGVIEARATDPQADMVELKELIDEY
ncbi:hypothetical protein [uncultured Dialister sp.]|jgi:hypothetical protein|uniref:hypothetical protein n=1 Tax=uncultured Dialister sp. TaxID=278064 RepID=UPI0025CD3617|nr:hypothetical protein [uncultured Dialister sp.]